MKSVLRLVVLAGSLALPLIGGLWAQGGPPVGGPPPCWPPPCIPVDGGISLLIGAGVLLGAKRAKQLVTDRVRVVVIVKATIESPSGIGSGKSFAEWIAIRIVPCKSI